MRPQGRVLGVLSAHLSGGGELTGGLEAAQFLADAVAAALLLDPQTTDTSGPSGPWSGRAHIHQPPAWWSHSWSSPADALALLRARAWAEDATLDDIVTQVLAATLVFGKD